MIFVVSSALRVMKNRKALGPPGTLLDRTFEWPD